MIKNNHNSTHFFNILKPKSRNKRNKYVLNKDYMDYTFAYFVVWSTLIVTRMERERKRERQADKQTETEIERDRQT